MNIGIITIAVGTHYKYLKTFEKSVIQKFLPGENITVYNLEVPLLPWPLVTLLRYHFICENKNKFLKEDVLYWMDADMIVVDVDKEVLPDNTGIVCVNHFLFFNKLNCSTFESNRISTAYTKNKKCYVQGCFQGGEINKFMLMCKTLKLNIEKDLSKNYIALWHDESHLNKYCSENAYKLLDPGYCYPAYQENFKIPFKKHIIHFNNHFCVNLLLESKKIIDAEYGAKNTFVNVSDTIKLNKNNVLKICNESMGCDPTPKVKKKLKITYKDNDTIFNEILEEGQTIGFL